MENTINELKDWKQVIPDPQRRIYLDKWLEKFMAVEKKIYHARDVIGGINSTQYKLGSGNDLYDGFIEWASAISYTDLPDQVITHEILNEIDVNMLELKTKREKDLYLTKLSGTINCFSSVFIKYSKTHPDYISRQEDVMFDEDTGQLYYVESQQEIPVKPWRQLNKDLRNRDIESPALTEFYIQLLVLVEVVGKIVDYAEDMINPLEQIPELDYELTSNSHKLVLFHKIGLFEPLYDRYYQHLGAVKFTKLISTILGVAPDKHNGFRPSVNGLIKEIIKPSTKKVVQTDLADEKVSAFLAEIGLIIEK